MTQFAEPFAWCIVQVTVFSFIATCLYAIAARQRWDGNCFMLVLSFASIGGLTLLCVSPWPRWRANYLDGYMSSTSLTNPSRTFSKANGEPAVVIPNTSLNASGSLDSSSADFTLITTPPEHNADGLPLHKIPWPRWRLYIVLAAWFAAAIGTLRLVIGLAHLWRCAHSSTAIDEPSMRELFMQVRRRLGLHRTVDLRESPRHRVAVTFGWRKPIVLLPPAWRQWSVNQRQAVLAHELAHVRQRHYLAWLSSQLALVAHFYHPLVHWLARRLRFEQELAADRLAARVSGGGRRYAAVLAEIALASQPPRGPITAVGLFMSRPLLMRRLAMLRKSTKRSKEQSGVKQFLALALVALAAIAVAGVRADQANDSNDSGSEPNDAPQVITLQPIQPTEPVPLDAVRLKSPSILTRYQSGDQPAGPATAIALIQVSRQLHRISGESHEEETPQEWQIVCKTQLALIRSYFVLRKAISDPDVSQLPLVRAQSDAAAWLANRLEVGFRPGSEIMFVQMSGEKRDADQLRKLVDAVVKAYEDKVVRAQDQQQLTNRDLLAQSATKLHDEIARRTEDYLELARATGTSEIGPGQIAQQLDINRLQRIEEELMRLENDQLRLETSGGNGNPKFFEKRIQQLSERQAELEKRIMSRSEASVDLSRRKQEIERLQRIADDLSMKLELMDVETDAPRRIQVIQPALVVGAGADANDDGAERDNPSNH